MAFVTHLTTTTTTDPYAATTLNRIILSCPSVTDALVLYLFDDGQPYDRKPEGWSVSDGRSLTGPIRTKGGAYAKRPELMNASFVVTTAQADLFKQLLVAQDAGGYVTIQDFFKSTGDAKLYWLNVDQNFLSTAGNLNLKWQRLTFSALEEV
jgi:hypothetical protein